MSNFQKVLTEAVADLVANGYRNPEQIQTWLNKLRAAAQSGMYDGADQRLRAALEQAYRRTISERSVQRAHSGISRFTIQRLTPKMQQELRKRIVISADLIKRNKAEAVEKTLHRFEGWASSIPEGGTRAADRSKVKADIKKSLGKLSYEERRVHIDQGHKLAAAINAVIAEDGGAIAVVWHSHWRQPNYNYREDHKERDGQVYLLRNTWATKAGLVKPGKAGYYDEVTHAGEEVNCRCYAQYLYTPGALPDDMRTKKGQKDAVNK